MILHALNDYYVRKASDPDGGLAPEGFELKAIPFVLVIDDSGRLIQLADRREGEGKKRIAKAELVPQGVKKSVNVVSSLLWGNAEYVLGLADQKKLVEKRAKNKESEYLQRLQETQAAFAAAIMALSGNALADPGVIAVLAFLNQHRTEALTALAIHPAWPEIVGTNPLMTFQLSSDIGLVCQRPAVIAALMNKSEEAPNGLCLVTGESDVIERLHPPIKGVWDAQPSGANIVSVNNKNESGNNSGQTPAFGSYGKQQGYNSPVGKRAAFTYTTALNHLLAKGSRQRVQVGDASTVFWAEKASGEPFEGAFLDFIEVADDPDRGTQGLVALYNSIKSGRPFSDDDTQRFYVLGLAPNAARIAVRFWHVATIADLSKRFERYFEEMKIVHHPDAKDFFTLNQLLSSLALNGERSRLPESLGGQVINAVLTGDAYPRLLLNLALNRCRAEQMVTHPRAAILKAWINRYNNREDLKVELDENDQRPAYLLGRLFAVLERLQEEANPGVRATIRSTYWSAASGAPLRVFPMLIDLGNRHLQKLRRERAGRAVNLEKLIGSIVSRLDSTTPFPNSFSSVEQAVFIVGFYQQKQHPSTYKMQGD